jgi:hypothetical protein
MEQFKIVSCDEITAYGWAFALQDWCVSNQKIIVLGKYTIPYNDLKPTINCF